jgi:hypothetical protein
MTPSNWNPKFFALSIDPSVPIDTHIELAITRESDPGGNNTAAWPVSTQVFTSHTRNMNMMLYI